VLNEYNSKDKAIQDLSRLAGKEITESDLLKEFKNK
jgi:hypothetical protein